MNNQSKILLILPIVLLSTIAKSQSSEIIKLEEKNAYEYKSYYENGSIKSLVGFYTDKPYASVEAFEEKLKDYKVKYHGKKAEFYQSGQLKDIVVYDKGKVIELGKHYFEDGEEYAVPTDVFPEFQFDLEQQNVWLSRKVQEIEAKYNVSLEGDGLIVLEISKDGTIKSVKVRAPDKTQEAYLMEIAKQIEVKKAPKKNGQDIGTRFSFRVKL